MIAAATPLPWGFTNESWAVTLRDGRRLAVTQLADPVESAAAGSRVAALRPRLLAARLPLARPVAPPEGAGWPAHVRVTEFIDGVSGASLLGQPGGAHTVGRLCGDASRRMVAIDVAGAGLPDLWADPDRLATAMGTWAADLAADIAAHLSDPEQADLRRAVDELPHVVIGGPAALAHGDLVPVNVLVRDGQLAGLLDLDVIRLADPLFDAAWFDHIVGFHHRAEQPEAMAGFAEGAGIDLDRADSRAIRRVLAVARLLEILSATRQGTDRRARWLDHLRFALRDAGS